jgi:PilZ domain
MPPAKWEGLSSLVDDVRHPSAKESKTSPSVIEDNASPSGPAKATSEMASGGQWRSQRVRIEIPVDVYSHAEDQEPIFAHAKTIDVSAHGALLALPLPVEVGQTLRLIHRRTKREIDCHVLRFLKRYPEGGGEVAIEFVGMSPHFWAIASPPEDWAPNWAPTAPPQHRGPRGSRAEPSNRGAARTARDGTSGSREPSQTYFGASAAIVKQIQKHWPVLKGPVIALAALVLFFTLWSVTHSGDADSGANDDSSAFRVAPEDAVVIPGIRHLRLATQVDFDPDAVAWLRSSGQSASGKIPGFYSGSRKSNAYILIGQGKERRVVILGDGGLRFNVEYPVLAVAARVPKESVKNINWADPSSPQIQGDGLLIVRATDDPASGVIVFLEGDGNVLRGDIAVSLGHPVDYRQVPLGRVP